MKRSMRLRYPVGILNPDGTQYTGVTVSSPGVAVPVTAPPWKVSGGLPITPGSGGVDVRTSPAARAAGHAGVRALIARAHWMPPIPVARAGGVAHSGTAFGAGVVSSVAPIAPAAPKRQAAATSPVTTSDATAIARRVLYVCCCRTVVSITPRLSGY